MDTSRWKLNPLRFGPALKSGMRSALRSAASREEVAGSPGPTVDNITYGVPERDNMVRGGVNFEFDPLDESFVGLAVEETPYGETPSIQYNEDGGFASFTQTANQRLEMSYHDDVNVTTNATVEHWVRSYSGNGGFYMFGSWTTTSRCHLIYFYYKKLRVYVSAQDAYNTATAYVIQTTAEVADGVDHQVVWTFDNGTLKLYVDAEELTVANGGITVITNGSVPVINALNANEKIGIGRNGTTPPSGRAMTTRLWKRTLSASEVLDLYAAGGGLPVSQMTTALKTNLGVSWEMESDEWLDSSGNGHTATSVGVLHYDVIYSGASSYVYKTVESKLSSFRLAGMLEDGSLSEWSEATPYLRSERCLIEPTMLSTGNWTGTSFTKTADQTAFGRSGLLKLVATSTTPGTSNSRVAPITRGVLYRTLFSGYMTAGNYATINNHCEYNSWNAVFAWMSPGAWLDFNKVMTSGQTNDSHCQLCYQGHRGHSCPVGTDHYLQKYDVYEPWVPTQALTVSGHATGAANQGYSYAGWYYSDGTHMPYWQGDTDSSYLIRRTGGVWELWDGAAQVAVSTGDSAAPFTGVEWSGLTLEVT